MSKAFEDKKDYLESYARASHKTAAAQIELAELRESTASARSMRIDGMPHGTHTVHGLDEYIVVLETRIQTLTRRLQAAQKVKDELLDYISQTGDMRLMDVLIYRYIYLKPTTRWEADHGVAGSHCRTVEEVAEVLGYDERYTYKLYKKALEALPEPPSADRSTARSM